MESNELTEGDFLYHEYLSDVKEEIYLSDDESITNEDTSYSVIDDNTSDGVQSRDKTHTCQVGNDERELTDNGTLSSENVGETFGSSSKPVSSVIEDNLQSTSESGNTFFSNERIICNSLETNKENLGNASEPVPEIATDSQEEISQNTTKKKRFSTKNLIRLFCQHCEKATLIRWGERWRAECTGCKIKLSHQCNRCAKCFKTYHAAYRHVKRECKPKKNQLIGCPKCHFKTLRQKHMDDHERDKHGLIVCERCGVSLEGRQMKKHLFHECKPPSEDNALASCTSNVDNTGVSKNTLKKPVYGKGKLFLEKYCRQCGKTETEPKYRYCQDCHHALKYQCVTCCMTYKKQNNALEHARTCNAYKFRCTECNFQTHSRSRLPCHIQSRHQTRKCEDCGIICEGSINLKNHIIYECATNAKGKKVSAMLNALKHICLECKEITERTSQRTGNCPICRRSKRYFYCVCCKARFSTFSSGYAHFRRACLKTAHKLYSEQPPVKLGRNVKVQCEGCARMIRGHLIDEHRAQCELLLKCKQCSFEWAKTDKEEESCPACTEKTLQEDSDSAEA